MYRDFSNNSKIRMLGLVTEVENDKISDFTDWVGDRWYDFESWIGQLNIKNYLNNVNIYHKKVIDKNNTTKDTIEKIFGGWGLYENRQFTTESIENFILFVPFSGLLLWAFQKELLGESKKIWFGKTVWQVIKIVAVFSFMIEFAQLLFHLGTFQISDLTYNTLGGAVGGVIYCIGYKIISRKKRRK